VGESKKKLNMREKELRRKVGKENEKFTASNPELFPSSVFFVPFQVSFSYDAFKSCFLLIVRSEMSPKTLK
jgi:hypothetical protein